LPNLTLEIGVKTDPIEYRYSFNWLFRLLAEEGLRHVQLGTFFELYQLPDPSFIARKQLAVKYGLSISSIFTAHRELGGFFRNEHAAWEAVARRNYERLIEVGALVGAESVGSNPGAVMRDQMHAKDKGTRRYVEHMKELMQYARQRGVSCLTIEPMSCLAEPPTLPDEIRDMAEELRNYHHQHPDQTATVGYCVDVAHGYADQESNIQCDNLELLKATLPYINHLHLKNTDSLFNSTFGFTEAEREKGILDIETIRELLLTHADIIPTNTLVGYLEIGGPKTGRDYSDYKLEDILRESLRYLQTTFPTNGARVANNAETDRVSKG
jgi:ribulose-phosphate 3-epimerase